MPHIQHQGDNPSTPHAIKRTVLMLTRLQGVSSQAESCRLLPRSSKSRGTARPIAGESSNVGLVCSAAGRTGDRFACNWRRGLASTAMTVIPNDARLLGPADPTRIDVNVPAEMRHWVRELGKPAAQLKAAVAAVGPRVADVRKYLQRRRLYGLPR